MQKLLAAFVLACLSFSTFAVDCDVNGDGSINTLDIAKISAARGTTNVFGDPRDPDHDGRITVNDIRVCQLRCTKANCAI